MNLAFHSGLIAFLLISIQVTSSSPPNTAPFDLIPSENRKPSTYQFPIRFTDNDLRRIHSVNPRWSQLETRYY